MSPALVEALQPHVMAVALVAVRLVPIAFLCPLLGGAQTPTQVKLGVVLALAGFVHVGAGVSAPPIASALDLVGLATREVLLGTTLGLLASLPFDTARMGGRFLDLFRGSTAEAALPLAGTKEAASGDMLFQLLLGLAASGVTLRLVLDALLRSYAWAPLGTFTHTDDVATFVVARLGGALATALALGAPVAALSLTIDTALGLASRVGTGMNLQDAAAPLRILAGAAALWLTVGLIAARLEALAAAVPEQLRSAADLGVNP